MNHALMLSMSALVLLAAPPLQGAEILEITSNGRGPFALSADGRFVAGATAVQLDVYEAFVWSRDSGLQILGTLPGHHGSGALSVSADGSAVAGWSYSDVSTAAFSWTENTGMIGLDVPPGFEASAARALSDDGSTAAGEAWTWVDGHRETVLLRWNADGGMKGFELPHHANVTDVSADGSVAVGIVTYADPLGLPNWQPFTWDEENGLQDLQPPPEGWSHSQNGHSTLISPDGSTIVGARGDIGPPTAFRWTQKDGTQILPLEGVPIDMTPDASVIVGQRNNVAFVWDEHHGRRALRDVLIQEHGFTDTEVPLLNAASGVSADSMTILATSGRNRPLWAIYLDKPLVSFGIPGDYNGNGLVEQADLDLVLTNWGKDGTPPPNWTNDLPTGTIDQEELDGVLQNWGSTSPISAGATVAVPEPSSAVLVLISLAAVAAARPRKRGLAD